jgi:uncharacterized repeat protein (TIGR03803 family)
MKGKARNTVLAIAMMVFMTVWASSEERVLHSFSSPEGTGAFAPLVVDAAGNLYGILQYDGAYGAGSVYELQRSGGGWNFKVLYSFTGTSDGGGPKGGLVLDNAGNLYGTTAIGGLYGYGVVFELAPSQQGWTESVLYTFQNASDGASPRTGLTFDSTGNLYGTTFYGGSGGWGTIFRLSPHAGQWSFSVLYSFRRSADGGEPSSAVLLDGAGNLYGTAGVGGDFDYGVIYRLQNSNGGWVESTLYSFFAGVDGNGAGAMLLDGHGNLYGEAGGGGYQGGFCGEYFGGCGTVFKLIVPNHTSQGNRIFQVVHIFTTGADNSGVPSGALLLDSTGNLFGTAYIGNHNNAGTVFKLSPVGNSWVATTLHEFGNGKDGSKPASGVVMDQAGNLYGTTTGGGDFGAGVIFEITAQSR